jgi:hypothetical protein
MSRVVFIWVSISIYIWRVSSRRSAREGNGTQHGGHVKSLLPVRRPAESRELDAR